MMNVDTQTYPFNFNFGSELDAFALLEAWLTAPNTSRLVRRIARLGGIWHVDLIVGGLVVGSHTQATLGGAIRNALQAAEGL